MPGEAHTVGESILRTGAFWVGLAAETVAVVLIAVAVGAAVWGILRQHGRPDARHPWADIRLDLGRWLTLALEFLLAADVVRTAVAPNWEDIGKLAAIAVIRTGLNYFLHRDIEEVQNRGGGMRQSQDAETPRPRLSA